MNSVAVAAYMFLVISSYFSNKYVLSTLGFRFPMVFQGWQTLVGFLILRLLAYVPSTSNPTLTGEKQPLFFKNEMKYNFFEKSLANDIMQFIL